MVILATSWMLVAVAGQVPTKADRGSPKLIYRAINLGKPGWWEIRGGTPVFGDGTATGSLATQRFDARVRGRLQAFRNEFLAEKAKPERAYSAESKATVTMNLPTLKSGSIFTYWYTGGAHPNRGTEGLSVGMVGGKAKQLTLADLLRKGALPARLMEERFLPHLNAMQKARGATVTSDLLKEWTNRFCITPSGLSWFVDPYEAGSYADGDFVVKVSWFEMGPYIDPAGPLKPILATKRR